jgi:hypothetical protein
VALEKEGRQLFEMVRRRQCMKASLYCLGPHTVRGYGERGDEGLERSEGFSPLFNASRCLFPLPLLLLLTPNDDQITFTFNRWGGSEWGLGFARFHFTSI